MAERIRLNPIGGNFKSPAAPKMPSMGAPMHVASSVGATGMHSYLGHFSNQNFLKMGHNSGGHWIQGAVKHPGIEKAKARRNGVSTHQQLERDSHSKNKSVRGRGQLGLRFERGL